MGICHVVRTRCTEKMAKISLFFIWVTALLLMLPWAIYYKIYNWSSQLQTFELCVEEFPHQWQRQFYFLGVIFLMCYALPLVFIMACYIRIGYRVCHRDVPGITSSSGIIEKSKIKVIKMLAIVVTLFSLSWLPMYVLRIVTLFDVHAISDPHLKKIIIIYITPFVQWLGMSNCCMNPMVYYFLNKNMRRKMYRLMHCQSIESPIRGFTTTMSTYRSQRYKTTAQAHNGRETCGLSTSSEQSQRQCVEGLAVSTNDHCSNHSLQSYTAGTDESGIHYTAGTAESGLHYRGEDLCLEQDARQDSNYIKMKRISGANLTNL